MREFNPNSLIVDVAELSCSIYKNDKYDLPIRLGWEISIEFHDFDLGQYRIYEPKLRLCQFELPFWSSENTFDATKTSLNSWKNLVGNRFDFSDSWVDNLGDFQYLVKYGDIDAYKNSDIADSKESYDNQIDVKEIRFGAINGRFILTEIVIKIEFDRFNRHDSPFRKDWYSDFFTIKVDLEIKPTIVILEHIGLKTTENEEILNTVESGIDLNDYIFNIGKRRLCKRKQGNEYEFIEEDEYQFIPKIQESTPSV
jgi:hypothetical protein